MPKEPAARDRSRSALIFLLFFAASAFGQDAATVALEKKDLAAALKSADALTRATAARVALVKSKTELVPALREALSAEKDALAAREGVRAIVLLGSDDDVAFAASQLPRFPASLDTDFAEAVARIGVPRSTALYVKHVAASRDPSPFVKLALWGHADIASALASRFLAISNRDALKAVLFTTAASNVPLDDGIVFAALTAKSPEIVNDTVWYLVRLYAVNPERLPQMLREPATAKREGASAEEELGRELIRRMLGAKFENRPELLEFLRTERGSRVVPPGKEVRRFLTLEESAALEKERGNGPQPARPPTHDSQTVREPEFRLTPVLPKGLAAAILQKTKCSKAWVGVAKATVDRAGRVQALDLSGIELSPGCKDALQAMLELSLAQPSKIISPMESNNLLLVRPRGRQVCFDEYPPDAAVWPRGYQRIGEEGVKAPKVIRRVEPRFPDDVRRDMGAGNVLVVAEAVITREGCVRDIRLLRQSQWGALNAEAVLALAEWTFEPGKLDGVPVDVIFNLTVNFKLN